MSNTEELLTILQNTKRKPIFVDLNNILYRSYYVFSPDKFKSKQGIPNGHLFGLCQNIRTMDKLEYEIFLCEDSPCSFRKNLNEDYKANRNPSEKGIEFWKDYPKIKDLVSDLEHVHNLYAEGYEADDVMYSAAKLCSSLNKECYIFTMDKDLLQALDKNITIVHKVTLKENEEIKYESQEYYDKFPVTSSKLPLYRAFKGDSSDNLEPPVKRLPKDLIIDLVDYLSEHSKLEGYKIKKKSHEKWIKQLIENWSSFISNYKVMKLNQIDISIRPKSDKGSYMLVCDAYDLFQFKYYVYQHNIY